MFKKFRLLFASVSCVALACSALGHGNQRISTFKKAKDVLPEVFKRQQTTIYCGCAYDYRKEILGQGHCAQHAQAQVQWEHIVPASFFGKNFSEWSGDFWKCRNKGLSGRVCARKFSSEFGYMEGDLHNLAPAVDLVNGLRSNHPMGEIEEKTDSGMWLCQQHIPLSPSGKSRYTVYQTPHKGSLFLQNGVVEPQAGVRGRVARAYLYMRWAYPEKVQLTEEEWLLYHKWHTEEPPTRTEIQQHNRIRDIQGNVNPFVLIFDSNQVSSEIKMMHYQMPQASYTPAKSFLGRFSAHIFTDMRAVFERWHS